MRRWLIFTVGFTSTVLIILGIHTQTGFWTWYGPKWMAREASHVNYDQTMEGYDYTALMTRFQQNGWLTDPNIFVGVNHWWLSGKVDWALKGKKDVICFDSDARNYMYFSDPNKLIGKTAIIVSRGPGKDNALMHDIRPFCKTFTQLPTVPVMRHGVDEVDLYLYKCTDFHLSKQSDPRLPVTMELKQHKLF